MKRIAVLLALLLALTSLSALPALATESVRAHTPLTGSTSARLSNVKLAAAAIDGTRVDYGESFSFNDLVGPRTARYDYKSAINGRGVKVVGGGVAQVASCMYLAIRNLDCVRITEKSTYGSSYSQSYVQSSKDAILVDYKNDTDFCFRYTGDGTLTIYTYLDGAEIVCDVYESFY